MKSKLLPTVAPVTTMSFGWAALIAGYAALTIAAYLAGSAPPAQKIVSSSSFHSSQASTPGTRCASPPIAAPNVEGSLGGWMPPLPPDAQAGERWTTMRTFRPFALAALTLSFVMLSMCWSQLAGPGCSCSHDAHSRTQPAPSSEAVWAVGLVWPRVSLTPVWTADAGVAASANAASSERRNVAREERMSTPVIDRRARLFKRVRQRLDRSFSTVTLSDVSLNALSRTRNVSVCMPGRQSADPHQGAIEPPEPPQLRTWRPLWASMIRPSPAPPGLSYARTRTDSLPAKRRPSAGAATRSVGAVRSTMPPQRRRGRIPRRSRLNARADGLPRPPAR